MKRTLNIAVPVLIAIGLVGLFWVLVDGKDIPVLQPSGEVGMAQKNLFVFATILSLIVVVPVFSLLGYFAYKYRAGNTKANYMPDWGENKYLEGLWWGIPIVIIGVLSVTIYQTSHSLDPYKERSGGEPLKVQVVALRWKWLFIYPEQNVATLNYLPLPVDRPVKFELTSDAPMSAFWIPALGSQIYAMSGMGSQLNLKATQTGEFTGYTTNINGEGYAKMTFNTVVSDGPTFDSWASKAALSTEEMNMDIYDTLTEPKSVTQKKTYRLASSNLFSNVISKYGHAGNNSHGVRQ